MLIKLVMKILKILNSNNSKKTISINIINLKKKNKY